MSPISHAYRARHRPIIGIVDSCCAVPYGPGIAPAQGIGGTEATVLRNMEALASHFEFRLFQKACADERAAPGLRPLKAAWQDSDVDGPDAFVVINAWKIACRLRRSRPDIPISLWLHVHPGRHNRRMGAALADAGIDVVCVSDSHARSLREFLGEGALPRITSIPNPVEDILQPDATPRDPDRLLFASAPHKGLRQVFGQFAELRRHLPELRLAVADPGYMAWDAGPVPDGVEILGSLSRADLLSEMRRALCLFYPQTQFAETFGLVIAEANAVGTPALVHHGLGANDEVAADPGQVIDANRPDEILARIRQWRAAPPRIRMPDKFRQHHVTIQWHDHLASLLAQRAATRTEAAE
ncbi:MAG: glycosyltransferase [Celeribacter sp.]